MVSEIENLVIIGSGPGAYTAGFYAATANLKPIIIEMKTEETAKFDGSSKVTGVLDSNVPEDFIKLTREQAMRFDVTLSDEKVTGIYPSEYIKIITNKRDIIARACIIDDKMLANQLLNKEMLDENGLIVCKDKRTITRLPGIFACGAAKERHREAVLFASSGCMAALDAKEYIERSLS